MVIVYVIMVFGDCLCGNGFNVMAWLTCEWFHGYGLCYYCFFWQWSMWTWLFMAMVNWQMVFCLWLRGNGQSLPVPFVVGMESWRPCGMSSQRVKLRCVSFCDV